MTDTSLTYEIIERLFQTAVCITYNPLEPRSAWQYGKELQRDFEKEHHLKNTLICSKTAKLPQKTYHPDFHYFSDGTLIHCYEPWPEDAKKLEQILTALKIRGLPVKKIYAPEKSIEYFTYSDFLRYISEQSLVKYSYKEDLYIEPLPSKEDFVRTCFANGNILLTAAKDRPFPTFCRDCMALFADGRYYISKDYSDMLGVKNHSKINQLQVNYLTDYYSVHEEEIPQDYLDALYQEAEKYAWFASVAEVESKLQKIKTADDLIKMNKYIDNLFIGRTCLTVVNLNLDYIVDSTFMSPDTRHFAVFSDGLVITSPNNFDEKYEPFVKDLKRAFPDLSFRFEQAPEEYVTQLYRRLPEFQKGATVIYIEMLKQKARKLKRMTDLTHIEALDAVAQMAGWQNWRAVKVEDEAHARQLIDAEKWRKHRAAENNPDNPLAEEYRRYLKRHVKK